MDDEKNNGRRPAWPVRFTENMRALNPGVRILFGWLAGVMALIITAWRLPEVLPWLR